MFIAYIMVEHSSGTKRLDMVRMIYQCTILTVYVVVAVSCPLEYTATRGRIQSPGYPGYRNNLRCQIIVHRQNPDQVIYLTVEHFDLEKDQDFLYIEPSREPWTGSLYSGRNYIGMITLRNCENTVCKIQLSSNTM